MNATVVLIHGAWHGGWCFDRVLPLLQRENVPAIAVDLPGHGADPGPGSDLYGDAARVSEVLDGIDGDVVLLGHSYGGAVITQAGGHPAVRHLVYLCAFALDTGESCQAAGGTEAAALSHDGRPDLGKALISHPDGTTTVSPGDARQLFYADCDEETAGWAAARLGPHPMITFGQQPSAIAWRDKPSTYVVGAQDMAVHPGLQRILAGRCTTSVEWATGHSPFASQPHLVANLMADLARG